MNTDRKPTIIDMIALVGSTAVGLALCAAYYRSYWQQWQPRLPPLPQIAEAADVNSAGAESVAVAFDEVGFRATRYFSYFTLLLSAWTPFLLYVRLRKPRESMGELVRGFGTSACVTVTVILVARVALLALGAVSLRLVDSELSVEWISEVPDFGGFAAPAIVASWIILLLLGVRRLRKGWIEMVGLLLAVSWIVLYFEPMIVNLVRLL
jgi:hypothetical protein